MDGNLPLSAGEPIAKGLTEIAFLVGVDLSRPASGWLGYEPEEEEEENAGEDDLPYKIESGTGKQYQHSCSTKN